MSSTDNLARYFDVHHAKSGQVSSESTTRSNTSVLFVKLQHAPSRGGSEHNEAAKFVDDLRHGFCLEKYTRSPPGIYRRCTSVRMTSNTKLPKGGVAAASLLRLSL